jgi:hypothetical protein
MIIAQIFICRSKIKIGVVTNTCLSAVALAKAEAIWEMARGVCSALSEHKSRSDRVSGRERVKHYRTIKIGVVTN